MGLRRASFETRNETTASPRASSESHRAYPGRKAYGWRELETGISQSPSIDLPTTEARVVSPGAAFDRVYPPSDRLAKRFSLVFATRRAGLPPFLEATRVPPGKEFGLAGLMAWASPALVARPWGTFA
jgi:hypothetical protein